MFLKTAVCVDGSYVLYHTLFSAAKKWREESPNSSVLDEIDVKDENCTERPDICKYPDFMECLESKLMEAFYSIQKIVSDFNENCGHTTYGNIVVAMDPPKDSRLKSWRYLVYPDYKGKRSSSRATHPFNVMAAFNELFRMLAVGDKFRNKFGLDVVFADGCEADDIIATLLTDSSTDGMEKLLISSDHDYLQIDGVTQFTLEKKLVEIEQPYPELMTLTPKLYLLAKIITGDTSDNITQVFNRVGYKTAVKKYLTNMEYLTESLDRDRVAMDKFKRNTRLIDFGKIPPSIAKVCRNALGIEKTDGTKAPSEQ